MARANSARWMTGIFVVASLVTPGVVAAGQHSSAPPRPPEIESGMNSRVAPFSVELGTDDELASCSRQATQAGHPGS